MTNSSTRDGAKKRESKTQLAWIGHRSYIHNVDSTIFMTKADAVRSGWKNPSRVRITLLDKRKIYNDQ